MIKRRIFSTDTMSRIAADGKENTPTHLKEEVCRW